MGDVLGGFKLPAPAPEPKPVKRERGMFEAEVARQDITYTHPILMQCYFPVRHNARNDQFWQMENGHASMVVRAGILAVRDKPHTFETCSVPAGPKCRLVTAFINNFIMKHRSRDVPLGDSMRDGMKKLGVRIGGQNRAALEREIKNFAAAEIVMGTWGDRGSVRQDQTKISSRITLWSDRDEQSSMMRVSAEYYEMILDGGMAPGYWPALVDLQDSARAMDILSFMIHRLRGTIRHPVRLSPEILHGLFGSDIALLKNFWPRFRPALAAAHKWYPNARIELLPNHGGLLLRNSEPLIPYRKTPRLS